MNESFLESMKQLLGDEFEVYYEALGKPSYKGFRVNPLKITEDEFFQIHQIDHTKSPFAKNGYYTNQQSGFGYTPAYLAGLFYMQEPSASSAVTILDVQENDVVLDMCAAPGSKTTQILEKLNNTGMLIANEIQPKRAKILLENVEKNGGANCFVTNTDSRNIAKQFPECFDKVLCDAPCSGEGMMRKEDMASIQWSHDLVKHCAELQKEILENAYMCLKPGGVLVYSTCTLNMHENEYQVQQFLKAHQDMHISPIDVPFGRAAFLEDDGISGCLRIFPQDGGEGHFVARLVKDGDVSNTKIKSLKSTKLPSFVEKFIDSQLSKQYPFYFVYNDRVYGGVQPFINFDKKIHVLRQQVYLGDILKGRFEPSYHFYMSSYAQFKHTYRLTTEELKKYLHGEEIVQPIEKGYVAMCFHRFPLGGGKSDGHTIKNKYPKSFRTR